MKREHRKEEWHNDQVQRQLGSRDDGAEGWGEYDRHDELKGSAFAPQTSTAQSDSAVVPAIYRA